MREQGWFPSFAVQAATSCAVCSFACIISSSSGEGIGYYPLALVPFGIAAYLLDRLFLRRERSLRALVIFSAVLAAAMFASVLAFGGMGGNIAACIFAAGFCALLAERAARGSLRCAVEMRSVLLSMELCLLLLVIQVGIGSAGGQPAYAYVPIVAGCAVSILGVLLARLEQSPGARGWALIALAFAALFALLWLLVSYAAAPAGMGLAALWNGVTGAIKWFFGQIWRFFLFLISLLPQTEYEEEEMDFSEPIYAGEAEIEEASPVLAGVLLAVAAVAAIYGLVRLFIWLGRVKLGGKTVAKTAKSARKNAHFGSALAILFGSWRKSLRLRAKMWRLRSTPEGLLCILIKKSRFTPWHKRVDETPRAFLERLSAAAGDDGELRSDLERLIPAVDAALYSKGGRGTEFAGASRVRRRIASAARRGFVREKAGRLKGRPDSSKQ